MSTPENAAQAPQAAPAGLARLNTHAIGYGSLLGGSAGLGLIITAVARLFHDLSDGAFLLELAGDHVNHVFGTATAEFAGCLFGIVGACVLTGLAGLGAYLSRPRTIA